MVDGFRSDLSFEDNLIGFRLEFTKELGELHNTIVLLINIHILQATSTSFCTIN